MKPLRIEVPFSTPWFQVAAKTMAEGEQPYYSLRLPDYVVVAAADRDGQVVLVRQYRPAVERYTLELPAGMVDAGESPLEAARREMLEETGCAGGEFELLGPMWPDTGRLGNRLWCCAARGVHHVDGRTPEDGIETVLYPMDELERAVADGRFDHALHVAALWMARLHGRP